MGTRRAITSADHREKKMISAAFGKAEFTPEPGTRFGRLGVNILIAEGKNWPLYARLALFDDGNKRSAICTFDLGIFLGPVADQLRKALSEGTGTKPENIMVTATHTHNGPASWPWMPEDEGYVFVDALAEKVLTMGAKAAENLKPVTLKTTSIDAPGWCLNRRPKYRGKDGRVYVGTHGPREGENFLSMEGPEDNQLLSLVAYDKNSNVIGGLTNFACHPTNMYAVALFSADFPGPMCSHLEQKLGGTFLFLNGACGNLAPAQNGEDNCEIMGNGLAAKVIESLEKGNNVEDGPIRVAAEILSIPQRQATRHLVETATKYLENPDAFPGPSAFAQSMYDCDYHFYHGSENISQWLAHDTIGMWEWQRRVGARELVEDFEIQLISIGDFAMVGIPAELFCEFGLEIKKKSPVPNTFVAELANGWAGYIPTEEAFKHGGYETCFAMQSRLVPNAGRLMTDAALRLLDSLT